MSVRLSPLPAGRPDLLAAIRLPEDQLVFSDPPSASMAEAPPGREGHLAWEGEVPVAFFAIDRDYPAAHEFAETGSIGLRMFCVDQEHQGRGVATAVCRALKDYLGAEYSQAGAVYLTVNHRNPGARAVYLKGGFELTGVDYLGGGAGPQHVMRLGLR